MSMASSAEASGEKRRVAAVSVGGALLITLFKLVVGIQTNSLGILSEAAHSGLDLIAAIITLLAVSVADRPADQDHRYGHGKVENLSALFETLLLVVTCGWIIYEGARRLLGEGPEVEASMWGFAVIAVAIAVDFSRARALRRVARKYNSQALEADALHFSSDIWSSLVVLSGLVCVRLGYVWVDAVAAIVVSVLVLVVSYRLGRRTVDALMDRISPDLTEKVRQAASSVAGIDEIRQIRLRTSGPRVFADITVSIDRTIPFERAHGITEDVEAAVRACCSDADVTVHAEPHERMSESLETKITMIVQRAGFPPPHHLCIDRSGGSTSVDFHLEFPQDQSFPDVHAATVRAEQQIRESLPEVDRITIHMEENPASQPGVSSTDPAGLWPEIEREILRDPRVRACRDHAFSPASDRLHLCLTLAYPNEFGMADVHRAVTELENRLHARFPIFSRITIHPEP